MEKIERKTHVLDASGQAVGRLASRIAILLRGKNKATYLPRLDEGDIVNVINAAGLKFSGKKAEQKTYFNYSGFPGGLKRRGVAELTPAQILTKAVKDMLPPTKHRVNQLKRLIIK